MSGWLNFRYIETLHENLHAFLRVNLWLASGCDFRNDRAVMQLTDCDS